MQLPKLVRLNSEEDYKLYYTEKYCRNPIRASFGADVHFDEERFDHAFYDSEAQPGGRKDCFFSHGRARRIDYIEYVLKLVNEVKIYHGKDSRTKKVTSDRINLIIDLDDKNSYVVCLRYVASDKRWKFITAYMLSKRAAKKIRGHPEFNPR